MALEQYVALANVTLTSSSSSIAFSSISQGYRDLILIANGGQSSAGNVSLQFNSDTGANYNRVVMYGDGSSAASFSEATQTSLGIAYWETATYMATCNIIDYSAADKHKTVLSRSGAGIYVHGFSGRWANTAAISSIAVKSSGNFNVGTTFSLYGVR